MINKFILLLALSINAYANDIYSSINEALNLITINSYYIVIGAGDLFIKIRSPLELPENNPPLKFTDSDLEIQPKEGELIFFPSWLKHEVTENLTDSNRICIAGNVYYNEKVKEIGGRTVGLEPTRYDDWEMKGRCIDC